MTWKTGILHETFELIKQEGGLTAGSKKKILQLGHYSTDFSNYLKDNGCNLTILNTVTNSSKEKFDIILIGNIIETIPNNIDFIKKLSDVLEIDGCIISSISNIAYITNRIQFLNNDFKFSPTILHNFNLNSLILTLFYSSFSLKKLVRIKKETNLFDPDLKHYSIPQELIDSILAEPESTVTSYVFSAKYSKNIDHQNVKWILDFTKDITCEKLKESFHYINEHVVKVLRDREVHNLARIQVLEKLLKENKISTSGVSDKVAKLEDIITAKDNAMINLDLEHKEELLFLAGQRNITEEMKSKKNDELLSYIRYKYEAKINYLEQVKIDLQNEIKLIRQNKILTFLRKWDKMRGRKSDN